MNKTWKEFKAEVDALLAKKGLDENVELEYIDVTGAYQMYVQKCSGNQCFIEG